MPMVFVLPLSLDAAYVPPFSRLLRSNFDLDLSKTPPGPGDPDKLTCNKQLQFSMTNRPTTYTQRW